MIQQTILSCGVEELLGLKEQLLTLDEYKTKNAKLEVEEDRIEKEIAAKEKAMSDEIVLTNKKRIEEIAITFDEQIDKQRTRIKKVKSKKDRLKSVKVSERIEMETSGLQETNRQYKLEAKQIFKQEHVPPLCNTSLYYTFFAPKAVSEFVTIGIVILAALFILPYGLFRILTPKNTVLYFVVYFVVIGLLVFLYILINNATKASYRDLIYKVRGLRWKVKSNNRQIKAIQRRIKKDNDESGYGLEEFDEEIQDVEKKITEIVQEKKEALLVYDNTTRMIVADEIRTRHMPVLTNLKDSYDQVYNESKSYEEQIKEMSVTIANVYEMYMGKEFMSCEKIDALIQLMETRDITTISEAMNEYLQQFN